MKRNLRELPLSLAVFALDQGVLLCYLPAYTLISWTRLYNCIYCWRLELRAGGKGDYPDRGTLLPSSSCTPIPPHLSPFNMGGVSHLSVYPLAPCRAQTHFHYPCFYPILLSLYDKPKQFLSLTYFIAFISFVKIVCVELIIIFWHFHFWIWSPPSRCSNCSSVLAPLKLEVTPIPRPSPVRQL